jgi:transposase
MTTKSYSTDLRKRVIEYLQEGGNYKEASLIFKVSISALGRWYRRYKKGKSYEAKKRGGSRRKIDLKMLEQYVQANPDMSLKQASGEFHVSAFTISYWLKKLGYSYKKKSSSTWKQTRIEEINTKRK